MTTRTAPTRPVCGTARFHDLSVNRDSEEEDEVNVSWAATDPTTWGLGSNAYSTSLVVILYDGSETQTKTLSLGSRKVPPLTSVATLAPR